MNDRYLYRDLYRAKRTDNGEWIEGNLVWSDDADDAYKAIIIPTTGSNMFTKEGANGDLGFEKWYRVDPSTICKCTGLEDKNGKLIWEGDIVTVPGDEEPCLIGWDEDCAKWSMEQYGSNMYDFDNYWSGELEVIGSVTDNPELFEGEA